MKRLTHLGFNYTHVTDFGFISELSNLELFEIHSPDNEHFAETMPSLKNSPNLYHLSIDANIEDLDLIAENPELTEVRIATSSTVIKDISSLTNKPKLEVLELIGVDCSDMSYLLALKGLKRLTVVGTIIPDDIRDKLTEWGVSIENLSVEDYNKQQEELKRQAEERQRESEEQWKAYEQLPEVKRARLEKNLSIAGAALISLISIVLLIWLFRKYKKASE